MATAPIFDMYEPTPDIEPEPDTHELVAALQREAAAAEHEWERLREVQTLARRFYEGKPFGNETDGLSQIVLPDVQETVDYMAASVLRPFVSGDRVVEIEAVDEEDEDGASEATAALSYDFMRRQDGFRVLLDWTNSGLLDRYGVVKTMMTAEQQVSRKTVTIGDPVELEQLAAEPEEVTENPDGTLTVALKLVRSERRATQIAVPPEEFRFSPRARHEDSADYLAHCPAKTRSELVEMGFDREQVYTLPAYTQPLDVRDEDSWERSESTAALEEVRLWEEYARIDLDGDGIAERIRVFRVENEILRWADGSLAMETVEDHPFSVFCPFPRPHRMVGWSLADKVMDIQLARSIVARQLLDGMYNANMPRPIVETGGMDENTLDDLLSPTPGSPIRVARGGAVQPYVTSFDVGKSLSVMEWMTGERESRTGITRLNQGLDADALNKTATGTAMMQAQGQQQEEFISRNLGEAFARLMLKTYRMLRREGEPFRVKVDGRYKQVDPSSWPEEVNVSVRVGLGTGSRDKRIQARMAMVPLMTEGSAIKEVTPKHRFRFVDGLVRDLGLGQGDDFWKDPDAPKPIDPATGQPVEEPEEPDPEMLAAQAEQQREAAKLELEREKAAATLELKAQSDMASIEAMREKHALEMEQKREAAALEAQLARDKAAAEYELAVIRIQQEGELARFSASLKAADMPDNRPGGRLDA